MRKRGPGFVPVLAIPWHVRRPVPRQEFAQMMTELKAGKRTAHLAGLSFPAEEDERLARVPSGPGAGRQSAGLAEWCGGSVLPHSSSSLVGPLPYVGPPPSGAIIPGGSELAGGGGFGQRASSAKGVHMGAQCTRCLTDLRVLVQALSAVSL